MVLLLITIMKLLIIITKKINLNSIDNNNEIGLIEPNSNSTSNSTSNTDLTINPNNQLIRIDGTVYNDVGTDLITRGSSDLMLSGGHNNNSSSSSNNNGNSNNNTNMNSILSFGNGNEMSAISTDNGATTKFYINPNINNNLNGKPGNSGGTKKRVLAKTRPAFVNKLWNMLNDPINQDMIRWSDDGKSFLVVNREKFVHHVLPNYFKHSNFASFVRQLNMYGWHKVQDIRSGSMNMANNNDEKWQFENQNFIRGREDLLENIIRQKSASNNNNNSNSNSNVNSHGNGNGNGNNNANASSNTNQDSESNDKAIQHYNEENQSIKERINNVLNELEQLRYNQINISNDLLRIRKDNELLWKENMMARERHRSQQRAIEKILRFLSSMMPQMNTKLLLDAPAQQQQQAPQQVPPQQVPQQVPPQAPSQDHSSVPLNNNKRTHDMMDHFDNLESIFSPSELPSDLNTPPDSTLGLNTINDTGNNFKRPRYLLKNAEESPESHTTYNDNLGLNTDQLWNTGRISEIHDDSNTSIEPHVTPHSQPSQGVVTSQPIVDYPLTNQTSTTLAELEHNIQQQDDRIHQLEELVSNIDGSDSGMFDLQAYLGSGNSPLPPTPTLSGPVVNPSSPTNPH
ncbi:hypothetical protein TBLA_0A02000 [Henningerozyma blattae CBS 6284]|uniref:Heat shock transcription factor n=1 Tax=Henningerozyma blattae (strain ATCC 34711 / CBS 6284 / DSM 70876 / NBRC 10599 / NRRL Y-10934 / UCD 77-7) TaxID=1071380 RepID=I2GV49_HENB6|nr:hypothetical protein TBLA_0A02000 [Tetrapisispora blattae CBS 6284]CCH58001.1 hypothetical protein TBLA_0A02000 [Tetrapisispora blattae CBS 6284]